MMSVLAEGVFLTLEDDVARGSGQPNRIHTKGYTDNVVELMVGKLARLPAETQAALQELACLGFAEFGILSIVHKTSEEEIHSDLWEAVRLEWIVRLEGVYRVVQDRVQEASY